MRIGDMFEENVLRHDGQTLAMEVLELSLELVMNVRAPEETQDERREKERERGAESPASPGKHVAGKGHAWEFNTV